MLRQRKFHTDATKVSDQKKISLPLSFFKLKPFMFSDRREIDPTEIVKLLEDYAPADLGQNKKAVMSQIKRMLSKDEKAIIDLAQEIDREMKGKANTALDSKANDGSVFAFLSTVVDVMIKAKFPIASLLVGAAASSVDALATNTGMPSGGTDMCSNTIANVGCAQGFLTNGTAPWAGALPQYSRIISPTNAITPDVSDSAYQQLRQCIDIDKVGELVMQAYGAEPGSSINAYSASSAAWQSYQPQFNVQGGISQQQWIKLQGQLLALANDCKSYVGQALKAAQIAGIVIGAVAGVGLCALGIIYLYKNKDNLSCKPSCPSLSGGNAV